MNKKYLYILVFIFLGSSVWVYITRNNEPELSLSDSWIFKENQIGPVIGNLGGMQVSIPKPYAHFVEYENDPHFLKPRKGEPPKRTYQSKFRSFGFEFRYPDMVPLTSETRKEKRNSTIYNTMWMRAGVTVSPYTNNGSIQRIHKGSTTIGWGNGQYGYKQLPETLYGLVVNEIYGFEDKKRDSIPGNSILDSNIYHSVGQRGEIQNYIKCSNIRHEAAPCGHHFVLKNVKNTIVNIGYRIGFLPQWQKIQSAVEKKYLVFLMQHHTLNFS